MIDIKMPYGTWYYLVKAASRFVDEGIWRLDAGNNLTCAVVDPAHVGMTEIHTKPYIDGLSGKVDFAIGVPVGKIYSALKMPANLTEYKKLAHIQIDDHNVRPIIRFKSYGVWNERGLTWDISGWTEPKSQELNLPVSLRIKKASFVNLLNATDAIVDHVEIVLNDADEFYIMGEGDNHDRVTTQKAWKDGVNYRDLKPGKGGPLYSLISSDYLGNGLDTIPDFVEWMDIRFGLNYPIEIECSERGITVKTKIAPRIPTD